MPCSCHLEILNFIFEFMFYYMKPSGAVEHVPGRWSLGFYTVLPHPVSPHGSWLPVSLLPGIQALPDLPTPVPTPRLW